MRKPLLTWSSSILIVVIANPVIAAQGLRTSLGLDYSSGKYGDALSTDVRSLTFGVRYKKKRWTLKASLPQVEITGPGAVLGPDGLPLPGGGTTRTTKSGVGDLLLSVSYLAHYSAESKRGLSVKAKVKLPTASRDDGLGTGEPDVSFEIDPFQVLGKTILFGALGYKTYGDPSGTNYSNVWYTRAGAMRELSPATDLGISGAFRQQVTDSSHPRRSVDVFLVHELDQHNKLQLYLVRGFSDSSPDYGGGISWMHSY